MTSKKTNIEDVQASLDTREIPINRVGIKDIQHPITVQNRDGSSSASIATFSMSVSLPHDQKGTHMSRFIQMLNDCLLYTSPSPRDQRGSRMPSSA